MSDATKSKIKVKRKAKFQETVKVRQPKGPKPAPQLKMCQSEEGPVLLKVSKCPQSSTRINPSRARNFDDDSEHSSSSPASSTITTKSAEDHQDSSSFVRSLTSAPSFPEAELWNCIKPSTNSITTGALLSDWDSNRGLDSSLPCPYLHSNTEPPKLEECKPLVTPPLTQGVSPSHDTMDIGMQRNMHVSSQPSLEVGENYCSIFQGTCFPQLEMDMSWTMEGEISHATPEPIFALAPPISAGLYGEVLPPAPRDSSQEMQRLAALLDLIWFFGSCIEHPTHIQAAVWFESDCGHAPSREWLCRSSSAESDVAHVSLAWEWFSRSWFTESDENRRSSAESDVSWRWSVYREWFLDTVKIPPLAVSVQISACMAWRFSGSVREAVQ